MDITIYKKIFDVEHGSWPGVEAVARKHKVLSAYEEIYREEDGISDEKCLLLNLYAMFHREYGSCGIYPWNKDMGMPDIDDDALRSVVVKDIKYYGIAKVFKQNIPFFNRDGLKPEVREFILDIISGMDILDMSEQDILFARDYGLMDITRTKFKDMLREARHDPEKLSKYKQWAYNWADYFDRVANKYLVNVTERYGSVMIDRTTNRQVSVKLHCGGMHDPKIAIGAMFAKMCGVAYPDKVCRVGDLPIGTQVNSIPELSTGRLSWLRDSFRIIEQSDTMTTLSRGRGRDSVSPDTPVVVSEQ